MACRQYYDGLCTGGACEVCKVKESFTEPMQTPDQLLMLYGAMFFIALGGVFFAAVMFVGWLTGWI